MSDFSNKREGNIYEKRKRNIYIYINAFENIEDDD